MAVFGHKAGDFVNKKTWKSRIKKACREAGTYKTYFDHVIDTLAGILEKRDEAMEMYDLDPDEKIIVQITNSKGTAKVKNPLIAIWEDLNKLALNYWRDLGLTPAGLKKINEESFAKAKGSAGNSLLEMLEKKKDRSNE